MKNFNGHLVHEERCGTCIFFEGTHDEYDRSYGKIEVGWCPLKDGPTKEDFVRERIESGLTGPDIFRWETHTPCECFKHI